MRRGTDVATDFKRTVRYVVFKLSDMDKYLTEYARSQIYKYGRELASARRFDCRPPLNAVVVEQDWPEFDVVWALIEARVRREAGPEPDGKPRPELLALAKAAGARIAGTPDGREPVEVVFSTNAWRAFDSLLLNGAGTQPGCTGHKDIVEN